MNVSVIITTYNRPDALVKVLEGLKHQTRTADEVVVADDGSEPETADAVRHFLKDSPYPLYHVWQEDRGFRAAEIRNRAIQQSSGSYIVCLDGDCVPEQHFINDHLLLAEKGFFYQGKRVIVNRELTPRFTHETANSLPALIKYFLLGKVSNAHHLIRLPMLPAWRSTRLSGIRSCNMGFFREDLFAVNGFNQDFVGWGREDSELAVRLYRYGLRRKSHGFMAICYHLWHEENDRTRLSVNDALLQQWIKSDGYVCANGLTRIPQELS